MRPVSGTIKQIPSIATQFPFSKMIFPSRALSVNSSGQKVKKKETKQENQLRINFIIELMLQYDKNYLWKLE